MLRLTLTPGDYFTINGNIVVQLHRLEGERSLVAVEAPREMRIVRGAVLEREGGERPECVFDAPRWYKPEIPWDRSKAQALAAMRLLLSQMDGRDSNVQTLRRQLNHMFPTEAKQSQEVSNG